MTDGTARITAFLTEVQDTAAYDIVHPDSECTAEHCTPHAALRMAGALQAVLEAARELENQPPGFPPAHGSYFGRVFRQIVTRELLGEEDRNG